MVFEAHLFSLMGGVYCNSEQIFVIYCNEILNFLVASEARPRLGTVNSNILSDGVGIIVIY